ncbi:uroporphyrinogen-III synthase [Leucobacter sp. W1478]|uniref:uroporphyrinogen-III synthase n=1 Tax=Leucobacter sp. W1478 TaxID=3439065 RepID=UPI003F37F1CA
MSTPAPQDPQSSDSSAEGLKGAQLWILRGEEWGERVAAKIRERGGEPQVIPLLEIAFSDQELLQREVQNWNSGDYDWMVLTSMNAVRAIENAGARTPSERQGPDAKPERFARIAAVGPATARAASEIGLTVGVVPEHDFSTEGLVDAMLVEMGESPARVLFPVSNLTDDRLQRRLEAAGHHVERVTAYQTIDIRPAINLQAALAENPKTVVLVTSGSAAHALSRQITDPPENVHIAAIGHSTARALDSVGLPADVVSRTHTIDGLLDAVAAHLRAENKKKVQ